jgi:hypothetical protein
VGEIGSEVEIFVIGVDLDKGLVNEDFNKMEFLVFVVFGVFNKKKHEFSHDNKHVRRVLDFFLFVHLKDSVPDRIIQREVFLIVNSFE